MNAPTPISVLQAADAAAGCGRVLRREGTRIACPHCGAISERCEKKKSSAKAAASDSKYMQAAVYRCSDYECGHCCLATVTPARRLRMGLTPNRAVNLPMSMHIRELEKYNLMPGSFLGLHFPRRSEEMETASDNGERMTCVDCGADAVIRTSWQMNPLLRETTYHCTNTCCRGVFVAIVEIVCTLSPSSMPKNDVQLAWSAHIQRETLGIVLSAADTYDYTPAHVSPPVTGDLFAVAGQAP